jgi:2-keto-4-pentenoate hydratase
LGGWKIGGSSYETQKIFSTQEIYFGPILSMNIHDLHNQEKAVYFKKNMMEAELAFRLSDNINSQVITDPYMLVDRIAPSLELPYSSINNIPKHGLPCLIADCCASGGLILGKSFPINEKTKNLSETIEVKIHQNKKLVSSGSVKNMFKRPIDVIHDFINKARENNFTITPGQWVASGGMTSCKPINTDERVDVNFINLDCMNFKVNKNQNDLYTIL